MKKLITAALALSLAAFAVCAASAAPGAQSTQKPEMAQSTVTKPKVSPYARVRQELARAPGARGSTLKPLTARRISGVNSSKGLRR